ncbi:MAG: phosphatidylserine decarboxylase [Candidatus Hodarchaeales archaeon]|jgi:phosphatidylserine decarboxylase
MKLEEITLMIIISIVNEIEWLSLQLILGISISAIGAHSSFSNLNLRDSLTIGTLSGILSCCTFIFFKSILICPITISKILGILSLILFGILIVTWKFFRDPKRNPPEEPFAILSPADGKILQIRTVTKGTIPCPIKGKKHIKLNEIAKIDYYNDIEAYLIEINMSLLDVHVNRAPINGEITFMKYTPGKSISLRHWRSEIENPRNTLIIENDMLSTLVIQIGSKRISSIKSFFKVGDFVKRGERIGKITLGSQVDIVIPKDEKLKILVNEGDKVHAGESILALFNKTGE